MPDLKNIVSSSKIISNRTAESDKIRILYLIKYLLYVGFVYPAGCKYPVGRLPASRAGHRAGYWIGTPTIYKDKTKAYTLK